MNTVFSFVLQCSETLIKDACRNYSITHQPIIILGLSGGPDSVFLFHVLKILHAKSKIALITAHLDHEWRTTSKDDAHFCADLCSRANITLVNAKASDIPIIPKDNGSKENVGRQLRRHFFEKVRKQYNADFIMLAHHRQDQQETFFLRLLRGSTLNGLTCMRAIDNRYLRPLLGIDKKSILNYLSTNTLNYCSDPTNESDAYLRNRIRRYVIPALKGIDERFEQKLESTIIQLQEEDSFLRETTIQAFEKIFTRQIISKAGQPDNSRFLGMLSEFKKLPIAIQRRVLLHWLVTERVAFTPSAAFFNELCRFINQASGGQHLIGSWRLCKKGTSLWLEQKS
jgi:tRNA(Ile)-lysidine synthase